MTTYQKNKARARQNARAWQYTAMRDTLTWAELAEATFYFEKIGKRYGLLKEFKENGII